MPKSKLFDSENNKKSHTEIGDEEQKESTWASNEQIIEDHDASGINEIYSKGLIGNNSNNEDSSFNKKYYINPKFQSDTSSSDLTQGTPTETGMAPNFTNYDEANSASHFYSSGLDCSSTLIQVKKKNSFNSL